MRQLHFVLGLIVALPLLAWAGSGLLAALPAQVDQGSGYERVDAARVRIAPAEALHRAEVLAGRALPITALTLEQRGGRLSWSLVGGLGMDSIRVDAESGEAALVHAPDARTRLFRQAHFWWFAGVLQTPLLLAAAGAALCAILSGVYLAALRLRRGGFS